MRGLMMDSPLLIPSILRHAALNHPGAPIISRTVEGPVHRTSYADVWSRCQRLAHALAAIGLRPGERVGTLAWNGYRHLEIYYGVSGLGMICHTINPRLFPEQIAGIIRHADDAALFVDPTFVPLLEGIADALAGVRAVVVMTDRAHMPGSDRLASLLCYEELLAPQPDHFDWPALDEHDACGLCYTSGTTGDPKGVLFSHRSTVLHAMAICQPDVFGLSSRDLVLPVVPMFHVNAWGLPYAVPMVGGALVLPGARLDGASLHGLIMEHGVTCAAGVPTVWMSLLDHIEATGGTAGSLRRVVIGGAACPPVMMRRFRALGVETVHAWGMTETSPLGSTNRADPNDPALPAAEAERRASRQGRPPFGVELRIVDGEGSLLPRDGEAFGALQVRGPWIASGYLGMDRSAQHVGGWFETGDVATIDAGGSIHIVDRTKDVIKSGGEWISSIHLEGIAMSHPAVREAAVVARPDPRWGERPLLVVVLHAGASLDRAAMQAHYAGRVARWCVPDDLVVVADLPHTATGKLLKTRIRALYGGG